MARGRFAHATCLALVFAASLFATFMLAVPARGASPPPTVVPGGDTRSEGEGAGLVGSPIFVALAVVGIGAGTAAATLLVVRLTRND
jgi:hypothetical protein